MFSDPELEEEFGWIEDAFISGMSLGAMKIFDRLNDDGKLKAMKIDLDEFDCDYVEPPSHWKDMGEFWEWDLNKDDVLKAAQDWLFQVPCLGGEKGEYIDKWSAEHYKMQSILEERGYVYKQGSPFFDGWYSPEAVQRILAEKKQAEEDAFNLEMGRRFGDGQKANAAATKAVASKVDAAREESKARDAANLSRETQATLDDCRAQMAFIKNNPPIAHDATYAEILKIARGAMGQAAKAACDIWRDPYSANPPIALALIALKSQRALLEKLLAQDSATMKSIGNKIDAGFAKQKADNEKLRKDFADVGDTMCEIVGKDRTPPKPEEVDWDSERELYECIMLIPHEKKRKRGWKERFYEKSKWQFRGWSAREIYHDEKGLDDLIGRVRMRIDREEKRKKEIMAIVGAKK